MAEIFKQKTIREPLLGMVVDHMGQINCSLTHKVGCELVALLSAYREEDQRLFPQVYLFGPSRSDLLRVLTPGTQILEIGKVKGGKEIPRRAANTALKTCASLAIDGWCVYIRRLGTGFDFGLFRPTAETYSVGSEVALASSGIPAALLRRSAENTVEIINSVGGRLKISHTMAPPSPSHTKPTLGFCANHLLWLSRSV
jgi:hypothetical protein